MDCFLPFVYSAIAFSYCFALKNLFPSSFAASASCFSSASDFFGVSVGVLCGGGRGAAFSSV